MAGSDHGERLAVVVDGWGSNGCHPPPSALYRAHAVEQQLRVAVVRTDAHGEACALRIEQRQQIDLAALVQ